MTTLRIQLDDATAATMRKRAEQAGKTSEALAVELLARQLAPMPDKGWIPKFLEAARNSGGDSNGIRWTREELHER